MPRAAMLFSTRVYVFTSRRVTAASAILPPRRQPCRSLLIEYCLTMPQDLPAHAFRFTR